MLRSLQLGADHVKVTGAEDNPVTLERNVFHCGGGGPFNFNPTSFEKYL